MIITRLQCLPSIKNESNLFGLLTVLYNHKLSPVNTSSSHLIQPRTKTCRDINPNFFKGIDILLVGLKGGGEDGEGCLLHAEF